GDTGGKSLKPEVAEAGGPAPPGRYSVGYRYRGIRKAIDPPEKHAAAKDRRCSGRLDLDGTDVYYRPLRSRYASLIGHHRLGRIVRCAGKVKHAVLTGIYRRRARHRDERLRGTAVRAKRAEHRVCI